MDKIELFEAIRELSRGHDAKPPAWVLYHDSEAFEEWSDNEYPYFCEACAESVARIYRHGERVGGNCYPPRECSDGDMKALPVRVAVDSESPLSCELCGVTLNYSLVSIDGEMEHFRETNPTTPREWGAVLEILHATDDLAILSEIADWLP